MNKNLIEETQDIINQYDKDNINIEIIIGGTTRPESVRNAIRISKDIDAVIIHDAARPVTNIIDIKNLVLNTKKVGTLYHPVTDTIKQYDLTTMTLDRNNLYAVTTPQYFDKELFDTILNPVIDDEYITDETILFEDTYNIEYTKETTNNIKVTTKEDLDYIIYLLT